MTLTNDPKYDRGVKKLFGAYTEEDENGDRILNNEALENILQDFEICPQLCEWQEVAEALQQTVKPDKEGMNFTEFKKFLKKVAVSEFKKKKYDNRFPSHDLRHNAILAYLRADDTEALLERARECQMAHSREDLGHSSVLSDDSPISSRSHKPSSSKKEKSHTHTHTHTSSSTHRKSKHSHDTSGDSHELDEDDLVSRPPAPVDRVGEG
eukprot:CAMPEP_0173102676 /NCGR_PEP_ID=MMETSP1102-20130122/37766_1 /TAXON_ID=49646 /ORGANISM="Geminigera sp., Strain Caron Lab Isolate" /LENGTH=209 /DNA_ID=CAMNT_0013997005 /DNA_START=181 /DNA_END=807 /DNA_ORIENTATION=+